jgi:hypothetical protein
MITSGRVFCRAPQESSESIRSFSDVVSSYIRDHRGFAADDLDFYRNQRSLRDAIELAARCVRRDGKRQSHQRRLRAVVLNEAAEVLQDAHRAIRRCDDFHELITLLTEKIGHIYGLGELAIYDIAHRIGAYLGVRPEKVYLHRGTRDGAKVLGLDNRKDTIEVQNLPRTFLRLRPDEIEDCLCIYKAVLRKLAQGESPFVRGSKAGTCMVSTVRGPAKAHFRC